MLNHEFCAFLEYELSKAFAASSNEEVARFWCDGILLPNEAMLSQKAINDKREILATAFAGESGQETYELRLVFGRKALSRYARGLDIACCVPECESDKWLEVDQVHKKISVRLK